MSVGGWKSLRRPCSWWTFMIRESAPNRKLPTENVWGVLGKDVLVFLETSGYSGCFFYFCQTNLKLVIRRSEISLWAFICLWTSQTSPPTNDKPHVTANQFKAPPHQNLSFKKAHSREINLSIRILIYTPEIEHSPWKMMVGSLVTLLGRPIFRVMLNFRGVSFFAISGNFWKEVVWHLIRSLDSMEQWAGEMAVIF